MLALLVALAGCATFPPQRVPAGSEDAAQGFATSLANVRDAGRRHASDILGIYAELPAVQVPGIAAFRRDLATAFARLQPTGRAHFTLDEIEALTIHNADFWQAWFEFQPQDGSLLMLQSSLLLDAGELMRASAILTVGVQALPLSAAERRLWLSQQTGVDWTLFRRLEDLQTRERRWKRDAVRRLAGLRAAVGEWPGDGFGREALIQTLAGLKPRRDAKAEEAPVALAPEIRAALGTELAQLARHNPIAAIRYAPDTARAAQFGRLWNALVDEELPPDDRGMITLADLALELDQPDLALLLRRTVDARRGFLTPREITAVQSALARLLPAEGQRAVLDPLESGRLPEVQLTRPPEAAAELLPGMDPLVHPLLAEHAVREVARESLWIETAGDNAAVRAEHLRERSIRNSNVGRCREALADLDAALLLEPNHPEWHVDRAVMLDKLDREADAEAEFAAVGKFAPDNEALRSSLAVQRFAQQRFAQAEKLFRAAKPRDENYAYTLILGYYSGARRGAADVAWLQSHQTAIGAEWPEPILRFLTGKIGRRALLDAAQTTSDLRTTEQQCEAFFALGQVALIKGDRDTAQREFESCVQTGIVGFIEYALAKRELARLGVHERNVVEPAAPPATPAKPLPLKTAAGE